MGIDGMINQLKSIDIDKMIFRILSNSNLQYNLIGDIQKRIFEKGITATGKVLRTDFARSNSKRLKGKQGFYSKNTEIIKRAKSQPVNRVTLSDTGQFFNSFSIKHSKNFITISAETRKKTVGLKIISKIHSPQMQNFQTKY